MNGEITAGKRIAPPPGIRSSPGPRLDLSSGDAGPAAGSVVSGRYHLRRLLGTGGMGAVWLTQDMVLRRAVALKHVVDRDGEDSPNATREARSAARVSHPGVVKVHDVLVEDDRAWIVMEALPGATLSTTLHERGRLPVGEVVSIALQALSALQAIYEAGLVHRDVKPSNVQMCDAD